MSKKCFIPNLSEKELYKRAGTIKPVIRFDNTLHYIEEVHMSNVSYTWSPKKKEVAVGLVPLVRITTYHTYGYYALFKPSIAEVLAQVPEQLTDQVCAFEIVERPETAEDLHKEPEALNAGYHVAVTQLYKKGEGNAGH